MLFEKNLVKALADPGVTATAVIIGDAQKKKGGGR